MAESQSKTSNNFHSKLEINKKNIDEVNVQSEFNKINIEFKHFMIH